MTCATCSTRVERVLSRQEGVESASVNLAGASASVDVVAGAMAFSSVSVVLNALRLKRFDPRV